MNKLVALPDSPSKADILALQDAMLLAPNQFSLLLTHTFSDGVYAREAFLPKGTRVIGKIHKHGHLNIISRGVVTVWTEWGKETFVAPYTFTSKPGTKRVVLAHTDTIWTTIHLNPSNTRDLNQLEESIIAADYDNLIEEKAQ